jgi:IMP dehydrogenase
MQIQEALTFDDVLLKPAASAVLPGQTDTRTHPADVGRDGHRHRGRMAIAMAQAGGIGVIHKNLEPEEQAERGPQVKKFESGMVVNPVTIHPDATLADALALMERQPISGIPVVDGGAAATGKLVGILTNRDVRFATDPAQKVAD